MKKNRVPVQERNAKKKKTSSESWGVLLQDALPEEDNVREKEHKLRLPKCEEDPVETPMHNCEIFNHRLSKSPSPEHTQAPTDSCNDEMMMPAERTMGPLTSMFRNHKSGIGGIKPGQVPHRIAPDLPPKPRPRLETLFKNHKPGFGGIRPGRRETDSAVISRRECPRCTFVNNTTSKQCEMCGVTLTKKSRVRNAAKPTKKRSRSRSANQENTSNLPDVRTLLRKPPATPVVLGGDNMEELWTCPRCRDVIPEVQRQAHRDRHYAYDLQLQGSPARKSQVKRSRQNNSDDKNSPVSSGEDEPIPKPYRPPQPTDVRGHTRKTTYGGVTWVRKHRRMMGGTRQKVEPHFVKSGLPDHEITDFYKPKQNE